MEMVDEISLNTDIINLNKLPYELLEIITNMITIEKILDILFYLLNYIIPDSNHTEANWFFQMFDLLLDLDNEEITEEDF